jgi:hypothetical protein
MRSLFFCLIGLLFVRSATAGEIVYAEVRYYFSEKVDDEQSGKQYAHSYETQKIGELTTLASDKSVTWNISGSVAGIPFLFEISANKGATAGDDVVEVRIFDERRRMLKGFPRKLNCSLFGPVGGGTAVEIPVRNELRDRIQSELLSVGKSLNMVTLVIVGKER